MSRQNKQIVHAKLVLKAIKLKILQKISDKLLSWL
jgi:hypothetical protein